MEEIADVIGGGTPKSKEKRFFDGGEIPWLTPADLSGYSSKHISRGARNITEEGLNSSSAKLMPAGTVLFTSRAPIGYVVIAKNEISTNQGFKSFVIKSKDILPDYVYWWLKGNKHLAESMASGTTFLELSGSKAKQLPIPIAPPDQQKRIVAKIEELFSHIDAGIEALKKAKQLLKQYRQSVLKAAVTGELTKEWREARNKDDAQGSANVVGGRTPGATKLEPASELLKRILKERRQKWEEQQLEQFKTKGKVPKDDKWKEKYKEPESKITKDVELPDGWQICVFDQLITELKNGVSRKPTGESGLAIFRISAVRPMQVKKDDVRFLPKDFDSSGYKVENDDLLFTRYNGNTEFVGVCGKVRGLQRETVYPDKLIRARLVNKGLVSSDYVELSMNCGISKKFIRSSTKTTAGQSGVAGGDLKKCPVVLPSYAEQLLIAEIVGEKFAAIEKLSIDLDAQLVKAEKNKQSILASAFLGQIME